MHFTHIILILLAGISMILTSCSSEQEKIQAEFNTNVLSNSTLLYEYTDTFSGATNNCAGTFIDKWYGSEDVYQDVVKLYDEHLLNTGWVLWPEDVGRIWRKQNRAGLFSLSMTTLTKKRTTNPRGLYHLPDSLLLEAANYPTVYVISVRYMDAVHVKRCFGK
ncbi:MAG: hypothetical protein GWN30_19775 [Gammaproteobacteria bacterium]|nr:hypothetical protein [Gammaproteobacteria bacterium]